jgi:hypothetical protein
MSSSMLLTIGELLHSSFRSNITGFFLRLRGPLLGFPLLFNFTLDGAPSSTFVGELIIILYSQQAVSGMKKPSAKKKQF